MRIADYDGRLVLIADAGYLDVCDASNGRFSPDIAEVYPRWEEFREWARGQDLSTAIQGSPARIGAPSPRPAQSFCIGANYRAHVLEIGWQIPDTPMVFTKFPSCVVGPDSAIELSGPRVDWEVELVVVIGRTARRVAAADAWSYVAGYTVGQDISDRDTQARPKERPQFSLGKSHPGYGPIGPVLVTTDEFVNPDAVEVRCSVNGEQMQKGNTDDFVFSVSELIEFLSGMLTLLPGDIIFTGSPSGIGARRQPPRFLQPGDVVTSSIAGIGEFSVTFTPNLAPAP